MAGHIRSSSGAAICCNGFPCCQNPLSSRKAVDPPKTGRHRTASSISSSTSAAALYHDLSSNIIENTMIPQDYTGIVRQL